MTSATRTGIDRVARCGPRQGPRRRAGHRRRPRAQPAERRCDPRSRPAPALRRSGDRTGRHPQRRPRGPHPRHRRAAHGQDLLARGNRERGQPPAPHRRLQLGRGAGGRDAESRWHARHGTRVTDAKPRRIGAGRELSRSKASRCRASGCIATCWAAPSGCARRDDRRHRRRRFGRRGLPASGADRPARHLHPRYRGLPARQYRAERRTRLPRTQGRDRRRHHPPVLGRDDRRGGPHLSLLRDRRRSGQPRIAAPAAAAARHVGPPRRSAQPDPGSISICRSRLPAARRKRRGQPLLCRSARLLHLRRVRARHPCRPRATGLGRRRRPSRTCPPTCCSIRAARARCAARATSRSASICRAAARSAGAPSSAFPARSAAWSPTASRPWPLPIPALSGGRVRHGSIGRMAQRRRPRRAVFHRRGADPRGCRGARRRRRMPGSQLELYIGIGQAF